MLRDSRVKDVFCSENWAEKDKIVNEQDRKLHVQDRKICYTYLGRNKIQKSVIYGWLWYSG